MKRSIESIRARLEKVIDDIRFESSDDVECEVVASVWKGAGVVLRLKCEDKKTLIVKRIEHRASINEISKESYRVEQRFYRYFAKDYENIPICYLQDERVVTTETKKKRKKKRKNDDKNEDILGSNWNFFSVLSDLRTQFPISEEDLNFSQARAVMKLFAGFHAANTNRTGISQSGDSLINERLNGLWRSGTYWTLDRRRHELDTMVRTYEKEYRSRVIREYDGLGEDIKNLSRRLHSVAEELHARLSPGKHNPPHWFTIVHGDAKGANILLRRDHEETYTASLLDFQWVGGGLGCRDIAYFMISAVEPKALEREQELLRYYFTERRACILQHTKKIKAKLMSWDEFLERYEIALCDFMRWLCGYGLWGGPAEKWSLYRVSSILRMRLRI